MQYSYYYLLAHPFTFSFLYFAGTDYVDQSFESDMESQPDNEGDNSHNSNNQLQAHWNLATYLPDAAAEFFHWVIGESCSVFIICV